METIIDTKTSWVLSYDSMGEFISHAEANTDPKSSDKDDAEFSQSDSLKHACDWAKRGYTEVRPKVDSILDNLQERLADRFESAFVTQFNVGGADVDMGRFMGGEPECMIDFVSEPTARMGRVVRILVNGSVSWDIHTDWIISRGTAIVALMDTIHKMGCGLELWWEMPVRGTDSKTFSHVVKVHDSSEMVDIDNIIFSVAHPAMLRRLTFSTMEQSKYAKQMGVGGGYGCPTSLQMKSIEHFDVVIEKLQDGRGDIVRDPMNWVVGTVTGLGLAD